MRDTVLLVLVGDRVVSTLFIRSVLLSKGANMPKAMTPEEFKIEMEEYCSGYDTQGAHMAADALMCQLLEELGYAEGIEIFRNTKKWYA